MDESTDRRQMMEQAFHPMWPNIRRSPGVDACNKTRVLELIGRHEYETKVAAHATTDRRERELGPILSHLMTVRQAYLDGHEHALVLEDDVTPLLM